VGIDVKRGSRCGRGGLTEGREDELMDDEGTTRGHVGLA
jgi:hypothetical protein